MRDRRASLVVLWLFAAALALFSCVPPKLVAAPPAAPPKTPVVAEKYDPPDERIVLFAIGASEVASPEAGFELGYVVALLEDHPTMHALVVGHADPGGSAKSNHELSLKRARTVRQHLLTHGVAPERVMIATPRDPAVAPLPGLNRRADVYVFDPLQDEASARLGYEVEVRQE